MIKHSLISSLIEMKTLLCVMGCVIDAETMLMCGILRYLEVIGVVFKKIKCNHKIEHMLTDFELSSEIII